MKGLALRLRVLPLLVSLVASASPLVVRVTPAEAASHDQIQGSGSSWAYNAVNQWISDVNAQGLQVVFTSTGSAQGRQDFAHNSNDFAVSDIGYQGQDPLTGASDSNDGRQFVYLPIVSGGTAFPYQIRVGGQLVRNLRLSGQTLAKIFTNQITNWSDPQITADNNGRQLPSIPIVPVIHSEGSGSTAQFTTYLDTVFPTIWRPFAGVNPGLGPGKGFTEYFPAKGSATPENGSDQIMNFISAGGSNGAIGYDEYSYALGKNYPVAKVENAGKYFTLPNQYNVAVALTQAQIDPSTLLQTLTNVYSYNDIRTYPLSSYSYAIIPTSPSDPRMTTAKRQTLVDYLFYGVCGGQKEMGPIGYSSLPFNLVQASFSQIDKLKAADPAVDITARDPSSCNNPTFDHSDLSHNLLAEIAPQPPPCDQEGQGPSDGAGNCPAGGGAGGGTDAGGPAADAGGGQATTGPATTGGSADTGGNTAGSTAAKSAAAAAAVKNSTTNTSRRSTGSALSEGTQALGAGFTETGSDGVAHPTKTSLADGPPDLLPFHAAGAERLLIPLSILLLAIVLVGPPLLVLALRRSRSAET